MAYSLSTAILAILAVLSPLLTIIRLFQMKEWRPDRLREHLRREGWFGQLFGWLRPVVILCLLGIANVFGPESDLLTTGLLILAALNLLQFLLRRQRFPVWTMKAIVVLLTGVLFNGVLAQFLALRLPSAVLLLTLAQPIIVAAMTLLLLPLDRFLKARLMRTAATLRARHPNLLAVGITGSVGKTTTKELLAHLLEQRGATATPQYVNSEMGVAQWLCQVLRDAESGNRYTKILIVEMGAYRSGEIRKLCAIAQPSIGVLTAIGSAHRGLFGSEQAIRNAKAELLEALPVHGRAFVNIDSPGVRSVIGRARCPVTTVGTFSDASLRAEDACDTPEGLTLRIGRERFSVALRGLHNVTNVVLAIGVARHAGLSDDDIRAKLRTFRPLSHTFAVREEAGVTLLDDTHNTSPESMRAGLIWSAAQAQRPRVLLTSGLLEIGVDEEGILRELGGLAQGAVERVIFTTDSGRKAFAAGFGKDTELLTSQTAGIPSGSLLLCIGRMPLSTIQRLLPPT